MLLAADAKEDTMATTTLMTFDQAYETDDSGELSLTDNIDIKDFRNVDFEIINWPDPASDPNEEIQVVVEMGKLSGWTLAATIDQFPLNSEPVIKSYNVVGPELSIYIQGAPANTAINIQAWVFLH
jgi:hypothetical protein